MHGVKKKYGESEEEKAKQAAILKEKIGKYQLLLGKLKEKKSRKEYDDEALKLTESLLSINGECYTMWNYRRLTLLSKFEEIPEKLKDADLKTIKSNQIVQEKKLLDRELNFTQQALMRNVKSYWCWNQREWATSRLNELSSCPWKQELALCDKLLHYDARNFHCWNYRRYVVAKSNVSNRDELKFTTNLIEENFSNYSAWHQRSKLLPLIYQEKDEFFKAIEEELEIIKNAFYTMPNDSSAWFYHRWLVNQNPTKDILERELEAIEELLEVLESNEEKKWPKLTLVFLKKHLDVKDPSIQTILDELVEIDPKRKQFYQSMSTGIEI